MQIDWKECYKKAGGGSLGKGNGVPQQQKKENISSHGRKKKKKTTLDRLFFFSVHSKSFNPGIS